MCTGALVTADIESRLVPITKPTCTDRCSNPAAHSGRLLRHSRGTDRRRSIIATQCIRHVATQRVHHLRPQHTVAQQDHCCGTHLDADLDAHVVCSERKPLLRTASQCSTAAARRYACAILDQPARLNPNDTEKLANYNEVIRCATVPSIPSPHASASAGMC